MTSNLIAFWSHAESKRHNRVVEEETRRANVARETETTRHNLVVERETERSNVAREMETHRANVAFETETRRSNLARESETNRHNLATEYEATRHNKAQEGIGWANVGLGYSQLRETIRHNEAVEAQTAAYNTAYLAYQREVLAVRSLESDRGYDVDLRKVGLQEESLAESQRHNLVNEGIDQQNADTRQSQAYVGNIVGISSEIRQWLK